MGIENERGDMMFSVYKSVLEGGVQDVRISGFVKTLSVAMQNEKVVVYYLVDTTDAGQTTSTMLTYMVVGTGYNRNFDGWTFIGTVLLHGGSLVFHVFEADTG